MAAPIGEGLAAVDNQQMHDAALRNAQVYCNRGFLNPGDLAARAHAPEGLEPYSLMTMMKVAEFLDEHGDDAMIPAHGVDTFQPRDLRPDAYVRGWNGYHENPPGYDNEVPEFPHEVYRNLYTILSERDIEGFPEGAENAHKVLEGERAFEAVGGVATAADKALAIRQAAYRAIGF